MVLTHPVQVHTEAHLSPQVPAIITLRAYEVYVHLHGEQFAMIDLAGRNCRGGFGVGELLAYLYARTFPKLEWGVRFDEALRGQQGL